MTGASFFRDLEGRRIAGGCPDCTAYQTLEETAPGIALLQIHHDTTCPSYRRILSRRARGKP